MIKQLQLRITLQEERQEDILIKKATQLPVLSNRLEVFEGQNNNLIINDSYMDQ